MSAAPLAYSRAHLETQVLNRQTRRMEALPEPRITVTLLTDRGHVRDVYLTERDALHLIAGLGEALLRREEHLTRLAVLREESTAAWIAAEVAAGRACGDHERPLPCPECA